MCSRYNTFGEFGADPAVVEQILNQLRTGTTFSIAATFLHRWNYVEPITWEGLFYTTITDYSHEPDYHFKITNDERRAVIKRLNKLYEWDASQMQDVSDWSDPSVT